MRWVALASSVLLYACDIEESDLSTTSQEVAVTWQNVVGATATANNLTKTAANGWGNSGASSVETIATDGFVEFTTAEANAGKAAGLSVGDSNQNFTDIDFDIQPSGNGALFIYENSTQIGNFGAYAANDVLRVEALERVVRYYRNGALLHTSTRVPQFPMLVDTALFHTNATINNVDLSDFRFTNLVGVTVSGQTLTKPVGLADAWNNSGAITTRTIKADTGHVEFSSNQTTHGKVVGLSTTDPNQHFNTVDFGILLPRHSPNGPAQVFENGVLRFTDSVNWSGTDVFRVEVVVDPATGTPRMQYTKNGNVLFTSAQPVTYPLFADIAIFHDGGTVTATLVDSFWTNAVGAEAIGGNLFASVVATDWGLSGARTLGSITSGDGYLEFTTSEINRSKAAGLNSADTSQHLNDIDFALTLTAGNQVQVYENGTLRGTFGTYTAGQIYRVEVAGNIVRYSRNGVVFYTSLVTPTFPLFGDSALINQGATIKNATLVTTGDGIPRDPVSGYAVPLTQADWNLVFGAAGVTPKLVNQSWGMQDFTGNAAATIGAPLTASTGVNALSYSQPVAGWDRDAIVFSPDGGNEYLFQPRTIPVGPDPTVESVLMFSYASIDPPASTRRVMVIAGGSNNSMVLGMTSTGNLRVLCDGTAGVGTAAASGVVLPLFLQYDRTNSVARAYSEQEIVGTTFSSAVSNSTRGFGTTNNTGTSGVQSTLLAAQFRGINAEWTEAEMRAVMNVMIPGSVPW